LPTIPPTEPPAGVAALDWSDLRCVLAICRAGSLVGAARLLEQDHSTLFRKLNRIEDRAGVRFFERLPSGYAMTDAGEIALRFGERIESEFHALGREIDGRDARLEGTVRITAPDHLSTDHLPAWLAEFHARHPRVRIELAEGIAAFDLARREADLAVRATRKPPDESFGRKLADFRFASYATPAYLRAAGDRPLAELDWVIFSGVEQWFIPLLWKNQRQALDRTVLYAHSPSVAVRAAEAGIGVVPMSCYVGDSSPALVRASPTFDHLDMALWIVTHPVLRQTARVRALMTFLIEKLTPMAPLFAGERPARPASRSRRAR